MTLNFFPIRLDFGIFTLIDLKKDFNRLR